MGDWVLAMGDRRLDIGYWLWAKRVLEYIRDNKQTKQGISTHRCVNM